MSKRISCLKESPCHQCGCIEECYKKIRRSPKLREIPDIIFGNADFDYHDCGIWIALNASEMVEVDDED